MGRSSESRPARGLASVRSASNAPEPLARLAGLLNAGGEDLFGRLAQGLCELLALDMAWVGEFAQPDAREARTLSVFLDGSPADNFRYLLAGTPAAEALCEGVRLYPRGVRRRFPDDPLLARLRAESFVAASLIASDGRPLGLIAAAGRRPLREAQSAGPVLRILAVRAAAELERRRLAADLNESRERFALIAEHVHEVLWQVSPDWREMIYLSPGFDTIWGRRREEMYAEGLAFLETVHPEDRARVAAAIEAQRYTNYDRNEYHDEFRILRPDGGVRWIASRYYPVRDQRGKVVRLVGVARDVTRRREAELALVQAHAELERRVAERTSALDQVNRSLMQEVRERQRAEQALRDSKQRLDILMSNLPGMVYRCRNDCDWTMEFVSEGCLPLTGYYPDDLLHNRIVSYAQIIHPDDRERVWSEMQAALAARRPFQLLYRIVTAEGAVKWVWEQRRGVYDAGGELLALEGFITDVTERKRAEEALEQRTREQAAVAELGQRALAGAELSELMDTAARIVAEVLAADLCKVLELLPDGEMLRLRAGVGWKEGLVGSATVSAGVESQAGYTLLSREPVIVADLRDETRFHGPPLLHEHGVVSGMSVVIHSAEGPYGVLGVHTTRARRFNSHDVNFLQTVANVLGEAISRKRTEERLARSQASLAEAQRIARFGSWDLDLARNELHWSEEIFRIFEIDPGEFRASYEAFLETVHPEDRALVDRTYSASVNNRTPYDVVHRLLMKDGRVKYVRERGETVYDEEGRPLRSIGTVEDITERRLAEAEMRKLARALAQSADVVMITDRSGVIEYVNEAFERITGYAAAEVLGRKPNIIKSDIQGETFYQQLWKTILSGDTFRDIFVNRRKNGDLYYEEKTITPLRDDSGRITHFISTGKDITERIQAQERLDYLAHHDVLTGLPNRALFTERLNQTLTRAHWHQRVIAVMFLDLDLFKNINDTLGHDMGDRCLKAVAERLGEAVREGDTVARFGGDEFAILLDDVAHAEDVAFAANKVLEVFSTPFVFEGHEFYLTVSIGISLYPDDAPDAVQLMRNADAAMYRAKEAGRNNYQFYSAEMSGRALERLTIEASLRHALERAELVLYYQPQMDITSGRVIGVEALLRWRHPELGLIGPMQFITLAEETGLILPIGEWVLRTAMDQMRAWRRAGHDLLLAVNVSSRQFNDAGFVDLVGRLLKETGGDPSRLELEITEGTTMKNAPATAERLRALAGMGVRLAIDDFGTGYSSLSYLKRFRLNTIKIDKSFVHELEKDNDDAELVRTIITMGHGLKLRVVAEGVEKAEQLEFLRAHGCDAVQGYYFSRPVPAEEFERLFVQEARRKA